MLSYIFSYFLLFFFISPIVCDFSYNFTSISPPSGIRFLGSSKFSDCSNSTILPTSFILSTESDSISVSSSVVTVTPSTILSNCSPHVDLLLALPNSTAAVWSQSKQSVANEFFTEFSFRLHSTSRLCRSRKSLDGLASMIFDECSGNSTGAPGIRDGGPDGFAFVVQLSSNRTRSLGFGGSGLGFEGIENSLAVEFDFHSNPENGEDFDFHSSIHSNGAHQTNAADDSANLSGDILISSLGDAPAIHRVRIILQPLIDETALANGFYRATSALAPLIRSPLSSLCVYFDKFSAPIYCIPIALNAAVALEADEFAFVGFTAAAGERSGGIQILDWTFCETAQPC